MTPRISHFRLSLSVFRLPSSVLFAAAAALLLTAAGCRQDMRDQARVNPLTESAFFKDGQSARMPVEHTIARGHLRTDEPWFTGKAGETFVNTVPRDRVVDAALLARGRERFAIYCTPCHDAAGTGQGMIVQRGYTPPRSLHDPQLRAQPLGYYFDVMTRGFGNMPDYAAQVRVEDRWAIAAYIRALQWSQNLEIDRLPEAEQARVREGLSAASARANAGHGGAHE